VASHLSRTEAHFGDEFGELRVYLVAPRIWLWAFGKCAYWVWFSSSNFIMRLAVSSVDLLLLLLLLLLSFEPCLKII
jgi:hypothetical protein